MNWVRASRKYSVDIFSDEPAYSVGKTSMFGGERRTPSVTTGGAVYSMCAVSYESNVTAIKMEAGLPASAFRRTGQTTSMMCWRKQTTMHEAIEEKAV